MRYTMNLPSGTTGGQAAGLLPPPVGQARAWNAGIVQVHGGPVVPTPAPKPCALPPVSQTRLTQPSYVSPDMRYPSIYWTTPEGMHPPVGLLRDNPLPVPARRIRRLPGVAQRMRRVGGQSQITQPAVVQQWPQWMGR